jgi:long-chain acyl-CoA synthetase
MNFLEHIFESLGRHADRPVLQEIYESRIYAVTGRELLALVEQARAFILAAGLRQGDRCALFAPNSVRWAAVDLALMAEGIIVVPLYARQSPVELVAMMKDCTPARICCSDASLRDAVLQNWPDAPPISLFEDIFGAPPVRETAPADSVTGAAAQKGLSLSDSDAVAIIYTSGTSGEPKGVIFTVANLSHMLPCTTLRLDLLTGKSETAAEPDRVFHYLPLNFAASWIIMLTSLNRGSLLFLSTDLNRLADEMKTAAANYFLNVPTLLERVRGKVEEQIQKRGGFASWLFAKARAADQRRFRNEMNTSDAFYLWLANRLMFPTMRKTLGPNLKALICGSAPLAVDTQLFFSMIGIPVLQGYGLTETTGICTLDVPGKVVPGRVGLAIPGIEMILGDDHEILVRGPHIFGGYWRRPEATANVLTGGWFHTGDQGEVDANGYWRIIGRLKNLIILNSGHNIAPEPIEEKLQHALPAARQVVLVGNNLSFLAAVVTADAFDGIESAQIQSAITQVNAEQPHYKQIRAFYLHREPFTIENGLLTANGKLRREAIARRLEQPIREMYARKSS